MENRGGKAGYLGAEILGKNTEFASCLVPIGQEREAHDLAPLVPVFLKTFMASFGVGQRNLDHLRHLLFRLGNSLRTPMARDFYLKQFLPAAAAAMLLQSCQTLCDPMDCSPPGSAVPGILQARTPEWVAISVQCMKVKSETSTQLTPYSQLSSFVLHHTS